MDRPTAVVRIRRGSSSTGRLDEWGHRPKAGRPSDLYLAACVLAFFIECACPPDRRSATVGAGDIQTVEAFLADYSLTHIVCDACNTYYQLIGFIDESGVERRIDAARLFDPSATRRGRRAAASRSRV